MMVATGLMGALALVLCFVPLFNLLGFESAATAGALLGFIAAIRTARLIERGDIAPPLDPARRVGPTGDFRRLLLEHLLLIPLPMAIMTLNAVRVQNCDLALGAMFWLIIPTGSALVGQSVAWAASALPRLRLVATLGILSAEVGLFAWRLIWQPPITGHQWFIGYFPGSIYNEALDLPPSLLWYRLSNICLAVVIVLGIEVAWRRRTGRGYGHRLSGALLAATVLLGLWANRFELGMSSDRDDSIRVLGGHVQTEHFDIYYDPSSLPSRSLWLLAEDHEYNYARHQEWMDVDVVAWRGRRIKSFVYPNSDAQQRLLGSHNTMIARPWTHEFHIRWSEYAEGALSHEMAHIVSASFGGALLQLPTQGPVVPSIGMLEGLAGAAESTASELDHHTASAAMRRLNKAPDLRSLFNPAGFWSQPSRRVYTLMGSFVKYLVEAHGIDKLKAAYTNGDFQAAYGRSIDDLVTEWEGFIDEHELSDEDVALARYLYARGSIFDRVCARTMGELKRRAHSAGSRRDTARALALWEQIVSLEPDNPSHRINLADAQGDDLDYAAAAETLAALAQRELSPSRRATVREMQGDLAWRTGDLRAATAAYDEAMSVVLPASRQRRLAAKRSGVSSSASAREQAFRYFLGSLGRTRALYAAQRWAELAPTDPLPRYLVGLQLYRVEEFSEAARWLSQASGIREQALREQRTLLLGRARYLSGELDAADLVFRTLLGSPSDRIRLSAQDGRDRVAWKRSQGG